MESIIAVLGTLAGAVVAGLFGLRQAASARAAERADDHRREAVAAVTELAVAVSDHRRSMWEVGDAEVTGADSERVRELRDETHRTRSAVTSPAVRVKLLVSDGPTKAAAEAAVKATYAMRHPHDLETLETLRAEALRLHDDLIETAARALAA